MCQPLGFPRFAMERKSTPFGITVVSRKRLSEALFAGRRTSCSRLQRHRRTGNARNQLHQRPGGTGARGGQHPADGTRVGCGDDTVGARLGDGALRERVRGRFAADRRLAGRPQ